MLNRFPFIPIPSDWSIERLADLGHFAKGKGIIKDDVIAEGLPCIRYGDIYTKYDYAVSKFDSRVSREVATESTEIKCGDILIAGSGETVDEIGKAVAYTGLQPAYAGGDVIIFTPNNRIHPIFLSYTLETDIAKRQKRVMGQGNSVVHIYPKDLSELKILLPPLSEQHAIANCLNAWDEAIQKTEALIAQKALRKKWLMQQLLTGQKRLKGFEGEWKDVTLGDVFERVTRKNREGNTTVVTISAQRGFVKQTDFFSKNIASEITKDYFLVNKGEFCYNKSYSNGYPRGATKRLNDFDKAVVTTLYICFAISDKKTTNTDFFEQFFEANRLDKGLTKIANEGGRAHGLLNVTPTDFFSLRVSIPEYEEQVAIAQVLQIAEKEIKLLRIQAEKLREQKKGLMQVLLTGSKRLQVQNLID